MGGYNELEKENIGKLLMKFSIPAIVGMIVNALYNMVDRIFVGKGIGTLALSGIAVGYPLTLIIMAFGMLIGIGASALISIKLGEKNKDEAELILGNAIVLDVITSLLVTVVGLVFLEPLLRIFGGSEKTLPYAAEYMKYILLGAVLQNIGFGMNNIIRSEGSPKIAMATMLIGAIINTILDPIFIFVFHMGIKGAAIATILSQAVSSIWVMNYFLGRRSKLKFKKNNLKLNKRTILGIFSIGMSPFAMQLASSAVLSLYNKGLLTYGGELAVGAMGVINSIIMLIFMPIFGINQGAQPIIGYNYGGKNYERVKHTIKLAIFSGVAIASVGFIVIQLFSSELIGVFSKGDAQAMEFVKIGSRGIRIDMFMLPLIGFQIISSNFFQAIGKAKIAMFLSLSRQVIILIPILMIFPKMFGLDGVWSCGPVSDFISTILTAIYLYKEIKVLNKKIERGKKIQAENNINCQAAN